MRTIFALMLGASGCLSMNTFESARTLEAGSISHNISITSYLQPGASNLFIPMPAYSIHVGVARDFELGVLAGLPGRLRLMGKYNPLRTEYFDAAIAPGLWLALMPHEVEGDEHILIMGGDLPLILDVNMGPVSLIPFAGPGFAYSPDGQLAGMIVRAGVGLRFALGETIRLHPEFSTVIDPIRGEPIDYAFGIALGLGANAHLD